MVGYTQPRRRRGRDERLVAERPRFEILDADDNLPLAGRAVRAEMTGAIRAADRVRVHARTLGRLLHSERTRLGHDATFPTSARVGWGGESILDAAGCM